MNGRKQYKGEKYVFVRSSKDIGSGGNGAVYDIELQDVKYPLVAKFFEYEGINKEKRYKRFRNEIEAMNQLKDIVGVMEVVDKWCPQDVPQNKDEAWYLMPKARPYKVSWHASVYRKVQQMLQLATIIKGIHSRGGAHRDIKPENILILNGGLVLSDFGLYWGIEEERLTEFNERIGPYRILPPELEHVQTDLALDFRASDVYLFAKVLWMTLKRDDVGFRGPYQRGDVQIYLQKEEYEGVITFEPVHKLLEESTCDNMDGRITIEKCIEYLELQCKILDEKEQEFFPKEYMQQLLYDEHRKRIIANEEPTELAYEDKQTISRMLRGLISLSDVFVKSLFGEQRVKQIQVTDFQMRADGMCKLQYYIGGVKHKEYLFNIKKMICPKTNEKEVFLELEDVLIDEDGYMIYSSIGSFPENLYSKIQFTGKEKLIFRRRSDYYIS